MSDDDSESVSREASPCSESPRPVSVGSESPNENICTISNQMNSNNNINKITNTTGTNTNMNVSAISKMSSNVMHSGSGRNLLLQKVVGVSITFYIFLPLPGFFFFFCVLLFAAVVLTRHAINFTNDNFSPATKCNEIYGRLARTQARMNK